MHPSNKTFGSKKSKSLNPNATYSGASNYGNYDESGNLIPETFK